MRPTAPLRPARPRPWSFVAWPFAVLLLATTPAWAVDPEPQKKDAAEGGQPGEPADLQGVPQPPPIPEKVQSGEVLEPDVRIIEKEERIVEEYSVNGKVYAIKVIPRNAPAYYLVDTDGDGSLETRRNDLQADILVPQWVIFSWK